MSAKNEKLLRRLKRWAEEAWQAGLDVVAARKFIEEQENKYVLKLAPVEQEKKQS